MRGASANALKIRSFSPRSLAAKTSRTPETMATPARTIAIPVTSTRLGAVVLASPGVSRFVQPCPETDGTGPLVSH